MAEPIKRLSDWITEKDSCRHQGAMQRLGADRRRDDRSGRTPAPARRQGEEDQRTYTARRHQDRGGDLEKRIVTATQGTALRLYRNLAIPSARRAALNGSPAAASLRCNSLPQGAVYLRETEGG